ncbi:protein of unknown function [Pararobbsia alpina]
MFGNRATSERVTLDAMLVSPLGCDSLTKGVRKRYRLFLPNVC